MTVGALGDRPNARARNPLAARLPGGTVRRVSANGEF